MGRLRPLQGRRGRSYDNRSLVVSLDRPYDLNGADMFLTYERNAIKLAERLGLDLAYVTSMDIDADPQPAGRGERPGLDGPRRVLDPGRARQRDRRPRQRRQPGLPRRERDVPPDPAAAEPAGAARQVVCYKSDYRGTRCTGCTTRWSPATGGTAPDPDPESSLIGTIYEGYPVDAPFVVASAGSWVFEGTGVRCTATPSRTWSASSTTGSTPATRCSGRSRCSRTPRSPATGSPATATRRTTRTRRGRRLQLRHDALGRGALRRPAARHGRRDPRLRPRGHRQRAARLRRRPGRRQATPRTTTWPPSTSTSAPRSAPPPTCSSGPPTGITARSAERRRLLLTIRVQLVTQCAH